MQGSGSIGRVDRRFDQRRSSGIFGYSEREQRSVHLGMGRAAKSLVLKRGEVEGKTCDDSRLVHILDGSARTGIAP